MGAQCLLPLSKHQGGLGLSVVEAGRRAADEHGGPTVTPQRVLQDTGHLAVTVRHVGFLANKTGRRDEVSKCTLSNKRKGVPKGFFGCPHRRTLFGSRSPRSPSVERVLHGTQKGSIWNEKGSTWNQKGFCKGFSYGDGKITFLGSR